MPGRPKATARSSTHWLPTDRSSRWDRRTLTLVLANDDDVNADADSIAYFEGNGQAHSHGDFEFTLAEPLRSLSLTAIELVEALASGEVLVAELHDPPYAPERFVFFYHCDIRTEVDAGQELRIRRAKTIKPAT